VKAIPPPARTSTFVPPPKPAVKPQTYSVVVNEVPVKELLLALARDTKQNIDIHPGLTGLVSLNAINETLPAILDRVSKQVNMRYRMEGNTIIVSTDTPYMRTYRINYVNMTRDTTSTIGVTGDIASGGTGGSTGSTGTNLSTTVVKTTVKNDFWDVLRDNIRSILASTRARSQSQEERAIAAEERRTAREDAIKQAEAVSRAGQAAPALLSAAFRGSTPSTLPDVKDDIIINPVTGTVSVLGTERQHQLIQQHVDSITAAAQRQVLIEATIVEVSLSEAYQGGIDWSRLELGKVGWTVSQALLGGFNPAAIAAGAAAGNAFTIGYQNTNDPNRSINLTIKLLQEFGNTKVLSSPKLMALNNQTALLKVVDNIVYFEIKADTTTSTNTSLTTFNTTAKTVSVGVVMGVTPQINDDGRVTLSVRPTISRVVQFKNDPNPSLCDANRTNCIASPVPEVQTREMESVLQIGSGQTVILGGLMQDEVQRNREQVPGADKVQQPLLGEALRFRDERAAKSELIIFLRPTVVTNPSLASEELKFFERFLPQPETPPAKAGTTR
jgi:general secretion pathway protein D